MEVSFGCVVPSFMVRVKSLNNVMDCVSLCVALAILADRSVVHGAVLTGATTAVLPSLAMDLW